MKKTITLILSVILYQFSSAQDYYWVGDSGDMSDFANHWATTSGGSIFHISEPDQNSNLIFDANSFSSSGQVVSMSSVLSCHDFLAKNATNSPTFNSNFNTLTVTGSFSMNNTSIYKIYALHFQSISAETIDVDNITISLSFIQMWRFDAAGTWEVISDVTYNANYLQVLNGATLRIATGVIFTTSRPITLDNSSSIINNGSLIFESGANLVNASGSSLSGNDFVFKRNTTFGVSEGKYSIMGSPVTGASTSSLGNIVYTYDESQDYNFGGNVGLDRFILVTSPEVMTPGKGYFSANTGSISVTGMPNNGTVNVSLDYSTSVGLEGDYDGFNLVSNPYSAGLKVQDLLSANGSAGSGAIEDMIYIWVDGGSNDGRRSSTDYMTVNEVGTVGGNTTRSSSYNNLLGSFQGFFVKASGSGQTLSFTEGMRHIYYGSWDQNFFRETSENIFKIKVALENETLHSETLIGFLEDATKAIDPRYDAKNILAANTLNISTLIDNETYSIQGRPIAYDTDIIALSFDTDTEGVHQLLFDFENMPSNQVVNLYDTYTSKAIDLNANASYEFTSKAGNFADRFQLLVGPNTITAIDDLELAKVEYIFASDAVNLKSSTAIKSIAIYNFQGQILDRMTFDTLEKERIFSLNNVQERLIIIRATDIYGKVDVQKFQIK